MSEEIKIISQKIDELLRNSQSKVEFFKLIKHLTAVEIIDLYNYRNSV